MSTEKSLDPDVELALLSNTEKCSILLSALGPEPTKSIFKHMRDNDVKRLINTMSNTSKAPIWMVKKVLEVFYSALNEELPKERMPASHVDSKLDLVSRIKKYFLILTPIAAIASLAFIFVFPEAQKASLPNKVPVLSNLIT